MANAREPTSTSGQFESNPLYNSPFYCWKIPFVPISKLNLLCNGYLRIHGQPLLLNKSIINPLSNFLDESKILRILILGPI